MKLFQAIPGYSSLFKGIPGYGPEIFSAKGGAMNLTPNPVNGCFCRPPQHIRPAAKARHNPWCFSPHFPANKHC